MKDVDAWLADAARTTQESPQGSVGEFDMAGLRRKIVAEEAHGPVLVWRDVRTAMVCAGLAALLAFAAMESLASRAWSRPAATWLATPPAASPFGLLVGQ